MSQYKKDKLYFYTTRGLNCSPTVFDVLESYVYVSPQGHFYYFLIFYSGAVETIKSKEEIKYYNFKLGNWTEGELGALLTHKNKAIRNWSKKVFNEKENLR